MATARSTNNPESGARLAANVDQQLAFELARVVEEAAVAAARTMGLGDVPLLCAHEMQVPASNARSIPRCIRVMLLVNTERNSSDMRFVYLRSARNLRATP